VELAPAVAPAGFDRFPRDVLEGGADPLFSRVVGVGDEGSVVLLESFRVQLEQPCRRLFE
jgi:hypothetical protein